MARVVNPLFQRFQCDKYLAFLIGKGHTESCCFVRVIADLRRQQIFIDQRLRTILKLPVHDALCCFRTVHDELRDLLPFGSLEVGEQRADGRHHLVLELPQLHDDVYGTDLHTPRAADFHPEYRVGVHVVLHDTVNMDAEHRTQAVEHPRPRFFGRNVQGLLRLGGGL